MIRIHGSTHAISATCVVPDGVISGDVLIVEALGIAASPIATPTGWTQIAQVNQGNTRMGLFLRVVDDGAAEPASHVFTGWAATGMTRFGGVDPRNPLTLPVSTTAAAGVTGGVLSSITTTVSGTTLVAAAYTSNTTITIAGMAEQWGESGVLALSTLTKNIPGASGSYPFSTSGAAGIAIGIMIALNPVRTLPRIGRNPINRFTVYKRGWNQPQIIEGSGIVCTRAINSPGTFSAIIPSDQKITGDEWLGRWLTWEHPTGGLFSGYIEDAPSDSGQGTIEIVAVGHANILKKRRTIRRMRPASGPPGAILTTAMAKVQLDAGMTVTLSVSERGPQVSYEFRAESVDDLMSNLISTSGQEWYSYLDQNHSLHLIWRERVGRDETARVVFTEGINIAGLRNAKTINGMVNDLLAIADDEQYERAAGARIQSRGSIGQYGNFQDTRRYVGMVSKATLGQAAKHDLTSTALPVVTPDFQVPHLDWRLAFLREGTQFRLVSAIDNAVYRARVLAYSINVDAGVTTLTCDAVQDITRAAQQTKAGYGGIVTTAGA